MVAWAMLDSLVIIVQKPEKMLNKIGKIAFLISPKVSHYSISKAYILCKVSKVIVL